MNKCLYPACNNPARRKVTEKLGKCEACYQRDRANPWGSVARLPEDVTRAERANLRRVK